MLAPVNITVPVLLLTAKLLVPLIMPLNKVVPVLLTVRVPAFNAAVFEKVMLLVPLMEDEPETVTALAMVAVPASVDCRLPPLNVKLPVPSALVAELI